MCYSYSVSSQCTSTFAPTLFPLVPHNVEHDASFDFDFDFNGIPLLRVKVEHGWCMKEDFLRDDGRWMEGQPRSRLYHIRPLCGAVPFSHNTFLRSHCCIFYQDDAIEADNTCQVINLFCE